VGKIGQGAFATVYKVTDKYDGVPYAAKELDKRKFMKNGVLDQKVENEMNIMQRIQHVRPAFPLPVMRPISANAQQPNIVGYKDHLDWDDRLLIIIMEYVQGGDLGTLIQKERPLNEEAVRVMAKQLLGALGYLHEQNITHRDVKPDNILISSQQPFVVKLTDFGLSKMVDTEQTFLRTFCGTLLYCAPEVYNEYAEYDEFGHRNPRNRQRRQHGQRYDHAVDIWSLGGVLFYAMTGKPPYPVRNGISYSELLHQIMTKELDVSPLVHAGISRTGIDFIRRMLNRRPEARATVQMLEQHPWLGGGGLPPHVTAAESYDEISDDGLDQQASQLSLVDRHDQRLVDDLMPENEEYNDENEFVGYESEKENYTFGAFTQLPGTQLYDGGPGTRNPPRLFGEVNVSAIGSSGVMPERLNLPSSGVIPENRFKLPGSNASLATTDIQGEYEVKDSFDSEDTPKGKQQRSQPDFGPGLRVSVLSTSQSRSVNDLNNMTFDVESQDLGGAESIMENLNMRSLAASHFPSHDSNYFTTSKRKTSYEASDGSQTSASHDRPVIKRFKSEALMDSMTDYSSDDDGEFDLLAHVPPVARTRSSRQMDEPVNKSTYWTAGDRKSYHLRYPEMTQFQLDAFHSAAAARGEEFGPGKTPLWDLAMKYFPPTHYEQVVSRTPLDIETVSNASNDVAKPSRPSNLRDELLAPDDIPPTAQQGDDPNDIPDTLVPHDHNIIVPIPSNPPGKRIVASLQSTPESGIQGISIHVTESMLSWGRGTENTRIYEASKEIKIPKYAFKLMLWKSGYDPSKDFRPWNQNLSAEEEDAFHFYVSTKSTRGIFVNDVLLPSHDCKNPSSPSRHWMVLHDQDRIAVWKDPVDKTSRTEVIFRCAWGGSSRPRQPADLPALVPETRRLDELCARAERRVRHNDEHDFKIAEAEIDRNERAAEIGRERERSRVFELRRVEACRALAAKGAGGGGSRKGSPACVGQRGSPAPGPPGVGGRAVPVRGGRRSPGVDG
jgi:serine/threonine protein kinase